jgi:ribonuclease-3
VAGLLLEGVVMADNKVSCKGEFVAPVQQAAGTVGGDPDSSRSGTVQLEARLNRRFIDPDLLAQALAHRSWCAEQTAVTPSNERLEFLGDAVLGVVVAEHTYRAYPDLNEGELAKVRAAVVNTRALAEQSESLGLGLLVFLGKGEDASGGRSKASILADTFEAVIGAVFLDAGFAEARRIVLDLLADRIVSAAAGPGADDYKTRLQETCVHYGLGAPRYEVAGRGPDHARRYAARVLVADETFGTGEGPSKKDAEQQAAQAAWQALIAGVARGADGGIARGADGRKDVDA